MATFGVDNFNGELSLDGSTANFKFTDPDDTSNVAEVSISPKEFPEGVISPDSREVSDYAYSLVSKQLNDRRSERLKAANIRLETAEQDRLKAEKAATAAHFSDTSDSEVASAGTETRKDGTKQTVYNTAEAKAEDKKK
jgi:hypothetical protein